MSAIKKNLLIVLFKRLTSKKAQNITVTAKNDDSVKKPRVGTMAEKSARRRSNFICIVFIIVAYLAVFFLMRNKLLFTPDFGQSDAYHFNLSLKHFLSENLKNNTLPFWTNRLSGGYPLFSESQLGALFLPNLFFLTFFPFVDAYTLLFIFSFISLTVGFFLLLREFEVGIMESMLMSFIFVFNGAVSLRWVHLNLIQTFSLIPFLFYVSLKYLRSGKFRFLMPFSFIVSQMFFAGHIQIIFIGVLGLFLWVLLLEISEKKRLLFLCAGLVIGVLIAFPQILPTLLLSQNSARPFQLDYQLATSFPLTWSHLISFFNPYLFGNPRYAAYPVYSSNWGIFWENTPYLGQFFLPLFLISFLVLKKDIGKRNIVMAGVLFVIFTLLALGKNSPIYFVFNFFPFNLFRTPSKYLLMGSFFILFMLSIMVKDALKKMTHRFATFLFIVLMTANILDLVRFAFNYHLFVKPDEVLKTPEVVRSIPNNQYYLTIDPYTSWNNVFLKKGWANTKEVESYLFMKNFLYPNSNLIFGRNAYAINTGAFHLRRPEYIKNTIEQLIQKENKSVTSYIRNLLEIMGINTIVSGFSLKGEALKEKTVRTNRDTNIYIYTVVTQNSNWYYVPEKIRQIEFIDDFNKGILDKTITIQTAVTEEISKEQNNNKYNIFREKRTDKQYELQGDFAKDTFIAFRINYYPEWSASVDAGRTRIYKTNLTQMGIMVPAGEHRIVLRYENSYFKIGFITSLVVIVGYGFLLAKSKRF